MTTSTFAPAPSMIFASSQPGFYGPQPGFYGAQPGFYGQFGYDQPGQSPVGYGTPQLYGAQQFGPPQIPGQQFGGQPQLGIPDPLGVAVQLLPQLLWSAQQNLSMALHLVQQAVQPYGRPGLGDAPWLRSFARPYSAW